MSQRTTDPWCHGDDLLVELLGLLLGVCRAGQGAGQSQPGNVRPAVHWRGHGDVVSHWSL